MGGEDVVVMEMTDEEVAGAIKRLKTRKAPGIDGAKSEVVKNVCDVVKGELSSIIE